MLEGGRTALLSPSVGFVRNAPVLGTFVRAGTAICELETLGVVCCVRAPDDVHGIVVETDERGLAHAPVQYGQAICVIDAQLGELGRGTPVDTSVSVSGAVTGFVFKAPSSGRFYARAAPDKPAFVSVGDEIVTGKAVGLLEVMKTFHRLHYGGPGLPARARVKAILAEDQDDLAAGDPVLEVEPMQ